MSKEMQNLVFLMEPPLNSRRTSLKAGNMWLNRFLIDEDAAFELSGVNYLEKDVTPFVTPFAQERMEMKGKELSYFHFYTYTICCS